MTHARVATEPIARAQDLARAAHRAGLLAGAAGQPAVGARRLRAGLSALGWAEHHDRPAATQVAEVHHSLAARLLISLAHFEAEKGRPEYGMRLLDQAEPMTAKQDRGLLLDQRGLALLRTGRDGQALPLFDEAIAALRGYSEAATAVSCTWITPICAGPGPTCAGASGSARNTGSS